MEEVFEKAKRIKKVEKVEKLKVADKTYSVDDFLPYKGKASLYKLL